MIRLLTLLLPAALGAMFLASTAPASAQGQQCTTEIVKQIDFNRAMIDRFTLQRQGGKSAFVPQGQIKKSKMPAQMKVKACGPYAEVRVSGEVFYIKRSTYRATCTCVAPQDRDAAGPGVGEVKICQSGCN